MIQLLQQIMDRLDSIEQQLAIQNSPASYLTIQQKGEILRKAYDTGDKAKIREANKQINGR